MNFLGGKMKICTPLVHALMVGATPNPEDRFRMTLLSRYDFPVRYRPATPTTAIGSGIPFSTSSASVFKVYSIELAKFFQI